MKKLGITNIKVAKLAVSRDQAVKIAIKRLKNRQYSEALTAVAVADRMQSSIETMQNFLSVFEL